MFKDIYEFGLVLLVTAKYENKLKTGVLKSVVLKYFISQTRSATKFLFSKLLSF